MKSNSSNFKYFSKISNLFYLSSGITFSNAYIIHGAFFLNNAYLRYYFLLLYLNTRRQGFFTNRP